MALIVGCVVLLGLAGGAYAITRGGGGSGSTGTGSTGTGSTGTGGGGSHTATLSPPGNITTSASAPLLNNVRTARVSVPGQAYAVVVTTDGQWSFASLPSGPKSSIAVMQNGNGLAPTVTSSFNVPGKPHGEALTPDGRYLVVADLDGAVVIDVNQAEQGSQNPVAGTLSSPGGSNPAQVRITPDGQFAFVTLANSNTLAVFNLKKAIASGFSSSGYVGKLSLPFNPLGMALSPNGRWLYATTGSRTKQPQQGGLNIIDLHLAETHPATALKATVPAGWLPARIVQTDNGKYVWVTARDSNSVLCFAAAKLLSDPRHALVAVVRVGQAPIGLAAVDHGKRIIVADSNIHTVEGDTASLAVISTADALAGKKALIGLIPAGQLPRQLAMEPNGKTLLVTTSTSEQIQAVDISTITSGH